jgi:REP element-mobilizing transposase RayT
MSLAKDPFKGFEPFKGLTTRSIHELENWTVNEPFAEGQFYHIYNRGCNKEPIFFNEGNYIYLLRKTKNSYKKYGVSILAYCLMPNHYHFLLKQLTDRPLSDWIQMLFNGYVQAVNKQQERSGTPFQGTTNHVLVDKDDCLLYLARYIHLNPVAAKLIQPPDDWPYSNYLEWVEIRGGTVIDREFVKSYFLTPNDYREFVTAHIIERQLQEQLQPYYLD